MVVVLPTPLTPINRATDGVVSSFRAGSPTWSMSVSTRRRHVRAPSMSLIFSAFTRRRSSSTNQRLLQLVVEVVVQLSGEELVEGVSDVLLGAGQPRLDLFKKAHVVLVPFIVQTWYSSSAQRAGLCSM